MKYLLLLMLSFTSNAEYFDISAHLGKSYLALGIDYRYARDKVFSFEELEEEPYLAKIELGYEVNDYFVVKVAHYSEWMSGFPVNTTGYDKTEILVEFEVVFKDLINDD